MGHSFTWSPPPPNPIPVTLILYSPLSPHHPHPYHPILKSSWCGLFCPPAPRQQHQRAAGCKCRVPWKTKQNWKIKKSRRGWEIFTTAPWRGGEKRATMYRRKEKKERKKTERTEERKKERNLNLLSSSRLSDIHHHLLNTQRCGLGHSWFNDYNKQMKKTTLDFVWDHYDTFFVLDHQSPLGDSERPSIAAHDHFLIQWQLNWRLDGLLCKTMSCVWTEWSTLISLDALEAPTRADMLTTSLVILVLSSTYCPANQQLFWWEGGTWEGEEGVRGDLKKKKKPFISAPIWDSCRVTLGVAACLVSYPQSTRQWHADSRAWHQVSSQRRANPLFSKMEETQLHRAHSL